MNTLYRDEIFRDIKDFYTEKTEIDKDLVAVGELDPDEVMEFTDEDYNLHVDLALIPNLAFINLAFYVTYKGYYDILKLDEIDNPEFWYNKYFDLFLHQMDLVVVFSHVRLSMYICSSSNASKRRCSKNWSKCPSSFNVPALALPHPNTPSFPAITSRFSYFRLSLYLLITWAFSTKLY